MEMIVSLWRISSIVNWLKLGLIALWAVLQSAKQPAQGGEKFKKKFNQLIKINIVACLIILFVCFLNPSEIFLGEKYNYSKAFLF